MLEISGRMQDNSVRNCRLLILDFEDLELGSAREVFERSFCCQVIDFDRTRFSPNSFVLVDVSGS